MPGGVLPLGPPWGVVFGPGFGGGLGPSVGPLQNLGYEIAGGSPGFAASWSVTIVATAQGFLDLGASNGDPPKPLEDFERGWGADDWRWFFGATAGIGGVLAGQCAVVTFNTGLGASPVEGFGTQWTGVDAYAFTLSQTLAVAFSEGGGTETFGDRLAASVVASTDVWTANSAPENSTPVTIADPAPAGTSSGTTYYVRDATGTTFKLALSRGGSAVDVTADTSNVLLLVGLRASLDPSISPTGTFGEGIDTETFGDTLVVSVVASTDTFASPTLAPDNSSPVTFRAPAPSGITASSTYYVRDATPGGTTFTVAATLNGSTVDVTLDGSGYVLDVGPRTALADAGWATFPIGTPAGSVNAESFEYVRGALIFTVDPATDIFTAAGHPFTNGDPIQFAGPGLPSSSPSLAAGITYYARDVIAGVSFKAEAIPSTTAIDLTSTAGTGATVFGDPAKWWNETA